MGGMNLSLRGGGERGSWGRGEGKEEGVCGIDKGEIYMEIGR